MTSGFAYKRTATLLVLLTVVATFALTQLRLDTWNALLPFFEWMETTPFGVISKTWGAAFALVEAVHLLGIAVLGGSVLIADGQMLGVMLRGESFVTVQAQCHRLFIWALLLIVATGVFMACGVALKIYYLPVFWYKMLALATGVLFVFLVRRPVVAAADRLPPMLLRLVAISSLMIWFSVAATGRWIGFSG